MVRGSGVGRKRVFDLDPVFLPNDAYFQADHSSPRTCRHDEHCPFLELSCEDLLVQAVRQFKSVNYRSSTFSSSRSGTELIQAVQSK